MKNKKSINLGNLLLSLSDAIDLANSKISQHQQRTAYIALEICKSAGLSIEEIRRVFVAALLHDTGAITIEEKRLLHDFDENVNLKTHCLRGEQLLKRIPDFEKISSIVRYHHTEWKDWKEDINHPDVFASQILLLADYIERVIDREKYILHQIEEIIDIVNSISGSLVHHSIVKYFIDFSRREDFWFNLMSSRLYSFLYFKGPLQNVEVSYLELENISKLFRDIIDFKSPFTATHSSGVSSCGEILSRLYGLSEIDIYEIKISGNLHDIGKLIIPNAILMKPEILTKEEFEIMKSHSYYSYQIINSISGLKHIAEYASYHHEKLDGTGYPFHRKEKEISIGARIITVSDIFTAVTEDRPYRKGMKKGSVIKIINQMAKDKVLDSDIVNLLFDNYDEIYRYVSESQMRAQEFYDTRFKGF